MFYNITVLTVFLNHMNADFYEQNDLIEQTSEE